jgi:hypothetical protein
VHVETDARQVGGNRVRSLRFTGRARNERRVDRIDGDEIAE